MCFISRRLLPKLCSPPPACQALLCTATLCPCPCLSSQRVCVSWGAAQPISGHCSASRTHLRGHEELCLSSLRPKARKYFGLKILPLSIQGSPRELSHTSTVLRARKRRKCIHIIMPFSSYHMETIRNHILLSSP